MNKILRIAKMEFRMTAANKAFIIITILGPFLLAAVTFLPTLLARNAASIDEGTVVAISGGDDVLKDALNKAFKEAPITIYYSQETETLEQAVLDREIQAYIEIPDNYLEAESFSYFSATGADFVQRDSMRNYIGDVIVALRMRREGLDAGRIAYLSARPRFEAKSLTNGGEGGKRDEISIIMTAIAFTMLLYMTILLHGQSAGRSVLREKTSKTVEIMLSTVRPVELLFGKLFGQAAAGIAQYAIWVATAWLLIKLVGPAAGVSVPVTLSATTLFFLILFFILAFFLYSSAYAAIGSGAEDESHMGQLGWPIIVLLVLPMITASTIIIDPNTPFVLFLSFFPFTSPITMFIRILISIPPASEILLCVAILVVTVLAVTYGSAKIFRVGILMSGKRFKLGEILRWIRY